MAATPAWAASVDFLALLDNEARGKVLQGSRQERLPAGTVAEYTSAAQNTDVVQRGVVRLYQTAPDGRQASIMYVHALEMLGGPALLGAIPTITAQMVTDTTLLRLDGANLRALFESDLDVAKAMAVQFDAWLVRALRLVTVRSLGTMRERLCYDLLERACDEQLKSGNLTFTVTHEQLANSIGSVREVVSRALRELRQSGIVSTSPGRVKVLDVERLTGIVHGLVT